MGGSDSARAMMSPQAMSAKKALFELQVEHHHHDETYHREIARLSMHQRLNHMALHFAKYAGKVAASNDVPALIAVYVDMLIIALSTANVLNIELWDAVEQENREFLGLSAFGRALALSMPNVLADPKVLLQETIVATGRMAAACEKIDHLEETPFRSEIKGAVGSLSRIAFAVLSAHGVNAADAIHQRLDGVKQRLKLHGRI